MKKIILGIASIAVLFVVCTKGEPEVSVKQAVLSATINDPDTKTSVDGVNCYWSVGDALSVSSENFPISEGGSSVRWKKYVISNEYTGDPKSKSATFTGDEVTGSQILAVYPYSNYTFNGAGSQLFYVTIPTAQSYVENGIANGLLPMYALGSDLSSMSFNYLGGVVRIKLYSASSVSVKTITLSTGTVSGASSLYSNYYYRNNGTCWATSMDQKSITLNCGSGVELGKTADTATEFNIVYLGSANSSVASMTVKVQTTEGDVMTLKKAGAVNLYAGHVRIFSPKEFSKDVINENIMVALNDGTATPLASFSQEVTKDDVLHISTLNSYKLTESDLASICTLGSKLNLDFQNAEYESTSFSVYNIALRTNIGTVINLPKNITSLPKNAFDGCKNLTSINLTTSAGITSIGTYAFDNTGALTNLTIPASVTSLSQNWISYWGSGIQNYTVADGNTVYYSDSGVIYKIGGGMTEYPLNSANTSLTVPDGVTSIGNYSEGGECYGFKANTKLTAITLPSSFTKAVLWNEKITTITCKSTIPFTISDACTMASTGTLYVPTGCGAAYVNAWGSRLTGWTVVDGTKSVLVDAATIAACQTNTVTGENYWN